MDPVDPMDSILFADEDPMVTDCITSGAVTSQGVPAEGVEHARNVSQEPEKLSSSAADARLWADDAERNQTSSETSENQNGELAASSMNQHLKKEDPDMNEIFADQIKLNEKPDEEHLKISQEKKKEEPNEVPGGVNSHIQQQTEDILLALEDSVGSQSQIINQQTSDSLTDKQTEDAESDMIDSPSQPVHLLPAETEGKDGRDIEEERADAAEGCHLSEEQLDIEEERADAAEGCHLSEEQLDIEEERADAAEGCHLSEEQLDIEEERADTAEGCHLSEEQLDIEEERADAAEGCHLSEEQLENSAATVTLAPAEKQWCCEEDEGCVRQEEGTADTEPTDQPGTERGAQSPVVQSSQTMDSQLETHGGRGAAGVSEDLVDSFGSMSTSETVANGVEGQSSQCRLHSEERLDSAQQDNSTSRPPLDKESSPEIIVGSVENMTLKDATSEKSLLGNREDRGSSLQKDSLSYRTDEDKRTSSSDLDLDFAVLEMDSCHLNLDISKQKTSLRKKGSLARRKKPSRGSVNQMASDSSDTMFQDSTDAKPLSSPTSDTAEDEVFDKQAKAATGRPQRKLSTSEESYTVRKAAQPFKPSLIMPGLQDLTKSKLFNQERTKSDECQTSPLKSPTHHPVPPLVLPKPTTKIQKHSQNQTIAAENLAPSSDWRPEGSSSISNSTVTASVEEAQVVCKEMPSDSSSGSEGGKPRSDSGSRMGPRFTRTDSWSSVSSPRAVSRRESTSSAEGGEGGSGSTHSTPRRASIQGSAYAPIGFRPRRSSSIVLDSNNKLLDLPAPPSPAPFSPTTLEKDLETVTSSGVKSPTYTPPVWLFERKATATEDFYARLNATSMGSNEGSAVSALSERKATATEDFYARLNATSMGSNEGSAVSALSERKATATEDFYARLNATSMGSNESSAVSASSGQSTYSWETDRGQGQKVTEEPTLKKQDEEPETPSWMKAAQQTASHGAEQLPSKEVKENREKDDKKPVPPWAAELKKKNRPFVSPRISKTSGESNCKTYTTPLRASNDNENTPAVAVKSEVSPDDGGDNYSPSWMKSSQQGRKPPPPPVPSKPNVGGGSQSAARTEADNPMRQYQTPKWKLELAEKKKRREAEMMPVEESGHEVSGDWPSDSTEGSSTSASVPQWRQQLSVHRKPSYPDVVNEAEDGGPGPEWVKQTEERRARLMKSGLFEKAKAAEEC